MDLCSSTSSHPPPSPAQHSYATRIRQNITIKPSARLRQHIEPSPAHQPAPALAAVPQFPPPGIVLHPDDATSKVFLAIGRSFLSVDNRAMTIKDLAEMTVTFGLVCQNVSAASQAITTYIRSHMHRCEVQQDQPLLLRHTLSGTASDDDLLPGLHSRSGGAHCSVYPENRRTNFRRGTMVWYMSRSTGAPCPFARAGIRLCDYAQDGRNPTKENRLQRERVRQAEQCGQKRKRPFRGCTTRDPESDGERPPPKVKLTLRLKPLHYRSTSIEDAPASDSDSDVHSMSVDDSSSSSDEAPSPPQPQPEQSWCLPPYPRKSISIPSYTPSTDESYPQVPWPAASSDPYRRSPSAYSVGSPPPDSEDEDDDFHITMTRARRHPGDPDPWDADDSDADPDFAESPGPRSPSAPVMLPFEVAVKEEPTDVQGIVAAWDDFDDSLAGAKVAEVIAQAAAASIDTMRIKSEPFDLWSWESDPSSHHWTELTTRVKQEDIDLDTSFYPPLRPSSPISPLSQLPALSYSDSPSPEGSRTEWMHERMGMDVSDPYATLRQSPPKPFSFPTTPPPTSTLKSFSLPLSSSPAPPQHPPLPAPAPQYAQSLASLIQSMSMNSPISPVVTTAVAPSSLLMSPPPACISPHQTHGNPASDVVVVHTCQPCTPAISATQIEGIPVYQMPLGTYQLLRRIDTDFVNISPIVAYTGPAGNNTPWPAALNAHTVPSATTVTKGSPVVSGTWVPLATAQAFVRDYLPSLQAQQQQQQSSRGGTGTQHALLALKGGQGQQQTQKMKTETRRALRVFLADDLFERFPSALRDFHRSSGQGRMLGQFGPHFGSTLQASQLCAVGSGAGAGVWGQESGAGAAEERERERERCGSVVVSSGNGSASVTCASVEAEAQQEDTPLSATEREIFRALCDIPDCDWDKENSPPASPVLTEPKVAAAAGTGADAPTPPTIPVKAPPVKAAEDQDPKVEMDVEPAHEPVVTTKQPVPEPEPKPKPARDPAAGRPLRRSKRVAHAVAAAHTQQPRTRSRRGGARNSLS